MRSLAEIDIQLSDRAAPGSSTSTVRPNTSRLVGSVQCASSKIMSTGLERDSASICAMSASKVRCRRHWADGEIPIAKVYHLADIREAYQDLARRRTRGKIVLVP